MIGLVGVLSGVSACAWEPAAVVAEGYVLTRVAAAPLVEHPIMAGFGPAGHLYVADTAGLNLKRDELEKQRPGLIRRLEDRDGDGVFDHSAVFVDGLTFPQGALWHRDALYVASPPGLWRFRDTTGDGRADEKTRLLSGFAYTGNAASVHGPFLHPDGRLFTCHGRKGHAVRDRDGRLVHQGKAAAIWTCDLEGRSVEMYATGGMDNPVELVFSPDGDVLGTCNLMFARPRGDTLVHWVYGGAYPRRDFVARLSGELLRTGPLLEPVHNFGHVAVSGLCRIDPPKPLLPPREDELHLAVAFFNLRKVQRVVVGRKGAGYALKRVEDLVAWDHPDVHPTDVVQASDGSLLVVDTGGWFRIGCPVSQVARPEAKGAIYRLRPSGPAASPEPPPPGHPGLAPADPAALRKWMDECLASPGAVEDHARLKLAGGMARLGDAHYLPRLIAWLGSGEPPLRHATCYALIRIGDAKGVQAALPGLAGTAREDAVLVLRELKLLSLRGSGPADAASLVPEPALPEPPEPAQLEALAELLAGLPRGDAVHGRAVYRSETFACAKCHGVDAEGLAGPALSGIGRIRQPRDLLESIALPSASFVRGYASYEVVTDTGSQAGVIVGLSEASLTLVNAAAETLEIPRAAIREVKALSVSIMPPGFHRAMPPQHLADLLAYLMSLQQAP